MRALFPVGGIAAVFAAIVVTFIAASISVAVRSAPASVQAQSKAGSGTAIRPFHISIPEAELVDLRERIAATRWPDKETVDDESQGIRLAEVQALVKYWGSGYNWRNVEAKLNALPEFVTTIDGVDIQFIRVRSREPNALPLILTHGWPGSPLEFLKVIGPLTDPVAYGGRAQDAFDVVIPAIPGYGFSGKPTDLGWGPDRVARAWDVLMKRLGYTRYVSQGGDHGAVISDALARQAPPGLLGIHLTMPATIPPNLVKGINNGDPAPTGLTAPERQAYDALSTFFGRNAAYGAMMVTRPQTIGYALADSPSGLAAWTYEKIAEWSDSDGHPERVIGRDEILDDITLYWLTNTGASSSRFYWENNNNNFSAAAQKTTQIRVPVAITVFPHEIYRAPESWSRQAYPSLYYFHEVAKGGHFAAWEQPQIFSEEMRAAFRPLRARTQASTHLNSMIHAQSADRSLGFVARSDASPKFLHESAAAATMNRASFAAALPMTLALALFQASFTYASTTSSRAARIMTKRSRYSYSDTIAKLTKAMTDGGATIFATIDQSAAAAGVGLTLRPTTLIVFGNPKGGTQLMEASPLVALELPLKLLVWQENGSVSVAFVLMSEIAARYGITGMDDRIAAMDRAIDTLTAGLT